MMQRHTHRGTIAEEFHNPHRREGMFREDHIFADNPVSALSYAFAEMAADEAARVRSLEIRAKREAQGLLRPLVALEVAP